MSRITLFRSAGSWVARFDDPEVRRLFETDELPTGYTDKAAPREVLAAIQWMNPLCTVTIEEGAQ